MSNSASLSVWFEIPATDMARAKRFYEAVLGLSLRHEDCGDSGMVMELFVGAEGPAHGALIPAGDYGTPGHATIVYLNGGTDLALPLGRVEAQGGRVLMPKTKLNGPWGYIAHFEDSEGNRVGLHSME